MEDFLLALFGRHTPITIDNNFCCLLSHSVRQARIGTQNLRQATDGLIAALKKAMEILAENLAFGGRFTLEQHWD